MLNTRLRTAADNEFEKGFFKLMNNSAFGKTMGNIRNHKDMNLVTSEQKYQKYVMKLNFKNGCPFSKDLFAVEMGKTEIKMNKPVYLGQAILDLSKTLMYEFHYDYTRPRYGSKVKLCYMDNDSFVYEIRLKIFTGTLPKMWRKGLTRLDIQRMKTGYHPSEKIKKVIRLMKDELGGKIMIEFIALGAKVYMYRKIDRLASQQKHKKV